MLCTTLQQCFGLSHHCGINRNLINTGSLIHNSKWSSLCVAWTLCCRIASKLFHVNITLYIEHSPPPFLTSPGPPWDVRYPYVDHWNLEPCMRRNMIFVFLKLALFSKYESFQLYLFCGNYRTSFFLVMESPHWGHTPHFFLVMESSYCVHTPTLKSIVLQHQSRFHSSAVVNSECYGKYGSVSISVICWLQRGNIILFFREDCHSRENIPEPGPGHCVSL